MKINPRHMHYIVATAAAGSIRAASKQVNISEPAINAAISQVEDLIGYPIFNRKSSQGAYLTAQGEKFVEGARGVLAHLQNFERSIVNGGDELRGAIRIGCYSVSAPFVVTRIVADLEKEFPDVRAEIIENSLDEVIRDLVTGKTDLAFTYDVFRDSSLTYEPLFERKPHVIVGDQSRFASIKAISLYDLASEPLALLDLPMSNLDLEFMNLFRIIGVKPNIRYRVKNFEMARSLVGSNLAYSFGRLPIETHVSYDGFLVIQKPIIEDVPVFRMCLVFSLNAADTNLVRQIRRISSAKFRAIGRDVGDI